MNLTEIKKDFTLDLLKKNSDSVTVPMEKILDVSVFVLGSVMILFYCEKSKSKYLPFFLILA